MSQVQQSGIPIIRSDTGVVSVATCSLIGFYVNSTSSGTLVLSNAAGAISGTITPAVGFHAFPASCVGGLTCVIANTLSVTFFVAAG